jgi:hypothetical protein
VRRIREQDTRKKAVYPGFTAAEGEAKMFFSMEPRKQFLERNCILQKFVGNNDNG